MEQSKRFPLLAFVVLLHAGFLYLLFVFSQHRMPLQEEPPKEMTVQLIAPVPEPPPVRQEQPPPPPPPEPPKPTPPKPESKPVAPTINPTPAPAAPTPPAAQPAPTPSAQTSPSTNTEPTATPAPPASVKPRTVTDVTVIFEPKPVYPKVSARMGEAGTVIVHIYIKSNGLPDPEKTEVTTSSGYPRLDEAAKEAALQSRFSPHIEGDRAVPIYVSRPYQFNLPDD